jgi:hypothetical protein
MVSSSKGAASVAKRWLAVFQSQATTSPRQLMSQHSLSPTIQR